MNTGMGDGFGDFGYGEIQLGYEDPVRMRTTASRLARGSGEAAYYDQDYLRAAYSRTVQEEDVYPPVTSRGYAEIHVQDYSEPSDHGDYNLQAFYNATQVQFPNFGLIGGEEVFDDLALPDEGEDFLDDVEDPPYIEQDEDEGVDFQVDPLDSSEEGGFQLEVYESEDDDAYLPVSRFLAEDDFQREDWYDDPRGLDFRTAFACLKNRKYLAKKYLLDILSTGKEDEDMEQVDMDPNVLDEVTYALSELQIPGLAKLSVEKLCDLVVKYPTLDLRGYLIDMDVFYIAYVIWGIDFYMYKKYGDFIDNEYAANSEYESEEEDKNQTDFTDSLKRYWKKSLSWFSEFLSPNFPVETNTKRRAEFCI